MNMSKTYRYNPDDSEEKKTREENKKLEAIRREEERKAKELEKELLKAFSP